MHTIQVEQLEALLEKTLAAVGTPDDIAHEVAASLADSNLKGVDSHGVVRLSSYLNYIADGYIKPAARPEIVHETPTTALVRGNYGFGIHTLSFATDVAIRKAKQNNVACVGLVEASHTGRIGWFAERAAAQNVITMITGGGASRNGRHHAVAPYGGTQHVLSTNPITFGMPGGEMGTVLADFATSITAEGKLRLYRAKHEPVPQGWLLDKDGHPTTNAEDFYAGGAILPAGAHKGYALAVIAELLGGALLGQSHEFNWVVVAINIEAFCPLDEYTRASEEILHNLKTVTPAEGFSEVLIPGEPEKRAAERRKAQGIPIADEVWQQTLDAARNVGVDLSA
jgi:LDH2 family malate/lactate/ureidoglycolate dehydrogenase